MTDSDHHTSLITAVKSIVLQAPAYIAEHMFDCHNDIPYYNMIEDTTNSLFKISPPTAKKILVSKISYHLLNFSN